MMDVLWKDNNVLYNILCFLITENEKIFDRNDARLYWQTVAHIFGIFHHLYIGLFSLSLDLTNNLEEEVTTLREFRTCYLTGWSFLFQTTFLTLAVFHDALEWADRHETKLGVKIRYFRDIIFSGLVFPITLFVTSMFWCVYSIDRELVFPEVFDTIVPIWFNHCVHTNIVIVVAVETILQARRKPADFKVETILYLSVSIAYAVVYYAIYFFAGRWLYMVFGIMTWWQVCLFQLLIWTSTHIFYRIQFPINRLFHGPATEDLNPAQMETTVDTQQDTKRITANGNGVQNGNAVSNGHVVDTPFADKSWSLKYRMIRNQFENSSL